MRMKWMQAVVALIGIAAASGAAAQGQVGTTGQAPASAASQTRASAEGESQFDIGVNFYDGLTAATSGLGTEQTPKGSTIGGMLDLRYILRPLVGFEFTYSYNPANQSFAPKAGDCVYTCANPVTNLSAKANEIGFDYVAAKKFGSLRPFAVGGVGFFITAPSGSTYAVNTVVRPVFIFGGGADWGFLPHLGLRVQFRDNLYRAPNLSSIYPATGEYTYSAEPMGGLYYHF
jgi:opacity protein-like surface antigen